MPRFIRSLHKDLLPLIWSGDEDQNYESFQDWKRAVISYASDSSHISTLHGLRIDIEQGATVAQATVAANLLQSICQGGHMQTIVEDCPIPDDGFTMWQEIVAYYTQMYQRAALATSSAWYYAPVHNDMSVDSYTTKATRILKQLTQHMPERYSACELIQNMLAVDENAMIRTPPDIPPAIRVEWQKRTHTAQELHRVDPEGGHLQKITLADFVAYIRQQQHLNPTQTVGTHPVIRLDYRQQSTPNGHKPFQKRTQDTHSEECRFYSKNGWCRYKAKCRYVHHDRPSQVQTSRRHNPHAAGKRHSTPRRTQAPRAPSQQRNTSTDICRDYIQRRCNKNPCRLRHIKLADLLQQFQQRGIHRMSAANASTSAVSTDSPQRRSTGDDEDTVMHEASNHFQRMAFPQ